MGQHGIHMSAIRGKRNVIGCALALLCLSGAGVAQVGLSVPSSLDQTASITSNHGSHQIAAGNAGPVALPEDFGRLRLAPGYMLDMSVFGAPEMAQNMVVDDSGDIDVPLAGLVRVDGDTLREAEKVVAQALIDKHMMNAPQVTLSISQYAPHAVLVAGEVQQPGKVQLLAPRPLLDVLASVGGVTTAAGGDIEIHHPSPTGGDNVKHVPYANGAEPTDAQNTLVFPGDTVFVRRAGVIYVLGSVNHPGGYLMVNGGNLNVAQAIAIAGGTTIVASVGHTLIVRKSNGALIQLHPQMNKAQSGEVVPEPLQDGDMVYVPTSHLKAALVDSSAVLSSAASAAVYTYVR